MGKLLHSEQQLLRDWAALVVELFNGEMCYQVGTSTVDDKPHRDIDIRTMLAHKDFIKLKKIMGIDRLNIAISLWGQKVTGMPIDFQIQDVDWANKYHKKPRSSGYRSAVGIGGIAKG